MLYEFNVYQTDVENHVFWIAESKVLKGCVGQGETSDAAIKELEENEQEWLKTAKEFNIKIPACTAKKIPTYSGKVALRLSPLIHEQAAENANFLGISLNRYISDALSQYNQMILHKYNTDISNLTSFDKTTKIIPFQSGLVFEKAEYEELEEM